MKRVLAIAAVLTLLASPAEAGRCRFMKRHQTRQIEAQTGVAYWKWQCRAYRAKTAANVTGVFSGSPIGLLFGLFR